jgi:hypothetical protein
MPPKELWSDGHGSYRAQNADHSLQQVVQFSMSPLVQFRMSFDNQCTQCADFRFGWPWRGNLQIE